MQLLFQWNMEHVLKRAHYKKIIMVMLSDSCNEKVLQFQLQWIVLSTCISKYTVVPQTKGHTYTLPFFGPIWLKFCSKNEDFFT